MPRSAFLALLVVGACAGSQKGASGEDPCADVPLDAEHVWSAEIRAEFLGKGGTLAGQTREGVATKMDDLSRDWVMLRRSVCLDHFRRQVISREVYVVRARCLDENLQAQRAFIAAPDEGGARLQTLSDEIRRCGDR